MTTTTTTTSYGTWNTYTPGSLALDADVAEVLDGWDATDDETDAVAAAYRDAINAALPDSVSLHGNEFYGPAYEPDSTDQADYPHDENGRLDIAAIVESVDFWAIADSILADSASTAS